MHMPKKSTHETRRLSMGDTAGLHAADINNDYMARIIHDDDTKEERWHSEEIM